MMLTIKPLQLMRGESFKDELFAEKNSMYLKELVLAEYFLNLLELLDQVLALFGMSETEVQ